MEMNHIKTNHMPCPGRLSVTIAPIGEIDPARAIYMQQLKTAYETNIY